MTVALVSFASGPGIAQTAIADSSGNFLQPTPEGNPANLERFHPAGDAASAQNQTPPAGKFTAPSRIGATPVYGSPPGFGAGDTGYQSTNAKRRRKTAQLSTSSTPGAPPAATFDPVPSFAYPVPSPPPVPQPPPPPVIYPSKAAARPGAALPPPPDQLPVSNPPAEVYPAAAASRRGAVLPIPPAVDFEASASTPPPGTLPLNTVPLGTPTRALPLAAGDPYAALGIRAGSFLILPALEMSAGSDSNPQHVPGGGSSLYFVVAPELHASSDWSRHSLTADIVGSYTDYTADFTPSLDRPYLNSKIDGRIDVARDTQIVLENRVIVTTDNPGSPNITAGLAKLPIDTTIGGTVGVTQQFNRLDIGLRGTFDRSTYQDSTLTDGETASNADRNFNQYAGILRVGYEIDPGLKPFVEASEDTRVYDEQFDSSGLQRSSIGDSAKVGATVNLFGSLTGELAGGYLQRTYKDPTLPNISGVTLDGSLLWQATALTTAKFAAASEVNESVLPGVSGAFSRDVNVQVDHAFRRWLVATLQVGYGRDDYVGMARQDNRYFTSAMLTYKLSREVQFRGQVREDWLTSTQPGVAYSATAFLLGARLQR